MLVRARITGQRPVMNASGEATGEERQAEGAKGDGPSGNRQGEALVVSWCERAVEDKGIF